MTKPITMDNNNARARRRSRRRYESSDHNFDTLLLSKYETRKTALGDQSYDSKESVNHARKSRSKSTKTDIYNGDYTLGTLSLKASKVAGDKESGPRRKSWTSSRKGGLTSAKGLDLDKDHNFDRLSQSFGSGNKMMQSRHLKDIKMLQKYDKNDYWKEYQEKYGKLGITFSENNLVPKHNDSYLFRTSTSLENVTSNSKPTSPRENALSSLTYSNTGVLGRHSFDRVDPDEADLDKSGIHVTNSSVQKRKTSNKSSSTFKNQQQSSCGAKDSDDEKSLENLSEKPPRSQSKRRAASDLGFPEDAGPTPRTSALLRQPSFRKHLAKIMHVKDTQGDSHDSLTLELAFKLASTTNLMKLKNSSEEEVNKMGLDGHIGIGNKLKASHSDNNLRCKSAETSPRSSSIFDWEIPVRRETFELNDPEEEPVLMRSFTLSGSVSSGDLEGKKEGRLKSSKFHIPSFGEFRKMRSKSFLLPDKPHIQKREKVIRDESDFDNEQKFDIERSMSFSQRVQEKQERPKQLRRTNTDPFITIPDLDKHEGQGQDQRENVGGQPDESVTDNNSLSGKDERSEHRKEHSRRKVTADLDLNNQVKGHSNHSRGHTVPKISSKTKMPIIEITDVQSTKHTKPKHKRSQNDNDNSVQGTHVKSSDSSENGQSSFKEINSWKQSVIDSEKGSDSENGLSDSGERTKRKRRSLRKGKASPRKVHPDVNCAEKPTETVNILVSNNEKKRHEKEPNLTESQENGTQSGKQPTGLPPVAPKKLRKKSDRKSPRQRQRSKYMYICYRLVGA